MLLTRNIAYDTGDYRFPMCNPFCKQITHGFEETDIMIPNNIINYYYYYHLRNVSRRPKRATI